MMLLSGDLHADSRGELKSITKEALVKRYSREKYKKIKAHVILGDGGWLWPNNVKGDLYNASILTSRKFPVYNVFGNHENYDALLKCPLVETGLGEKVYEVTQGIYYLQRGKIYTIDGYKCLVLGGGLSIDKAYRREHTSWWEQEYWSYQEEHDLLELLKTENKFDIVLSHTGPNSICNNMFVGLPGIAKDKFVDKVALFYDQFAHNIEFKYWFMGHWHENNFFVDHAKYGPHEKTYVGLYHPCSVLLEDDLAVSRGKSAMEDSVGSYDDIVLDNSAN